MRLSTPQPGRSRCRPKMRPAANHCLLHRATPRQHKTTPLQIVLIVLGTIAFLYFARPVVLPVFLACMAGMALKPLIRWLSCCHIPPALSAAVVLCFLVPAVGIGFFQLGRPALTWMNEAPQHMTELRQRVLKLFPRARTVQRGGSGGKQPGRDGRRKGGRTEENAYGGSQRQPWHQFNP